MSGCYICGRSGPPLNGVGICDPCRKQHLGQDDDCVTVVAAAPFRFETDGNIVTVDDDQQDLRNDGYDDYRERDKIREVEAKGFKVIRGTPRTLLLDLDYSVSTGIYALMIAMVKSKFDVAAVEGWRSKSWTVDMPRYHVVVHLNNDLPVSVRLTLQSILGSDPKRAVLDLYKLNFLNMTEPSLLFQPPNSRIQAVGETFGTGRFPIP